MRSGSTDKDYPEKIIFAFYMGRKADLVYLDIKTGIMDRHWTKSVPLLGLSVFWNQKRKTDHTQTETILPRTIDTFAFAVADGFDKA